MDIVIVCNPMDKYKGKLEEEVAREYHHLAITEFDQLIGFEPGYDPWKEKPDYEELGISRKDGREQTLAVFSEQPIIRVGNIHARCVSSSYLFNLVSLHGTLPDLDVVHLSGSLDSDVFLTAEKMVALYEKAGWLVHADETYLPGREIVTPSSERFAGKQLGILILDDILRIAEQKTGYVRGVSSRMSSKDAQYPVPDPDVSNIYKLLENHRE